ncbi:hypothetical protein BCV72DRAFT_252354 [Rhizopus microsporus var. microsporus]|uniref:DUF7905 domain-containing protein n=1 Tax=Rhizopus microsporus var. microsporus TaxID=86635 RepID=A0A1X0QSC4_RHIZD|nr:hypothetical protein BCV72DRAFT_252354 [Rhizopus microsporus var. microsporus]
MPITLTIAKVAKLRVNRSDYFLIPTEKICTYIYSAAYITHGLYDRFKHHLLKMESKTGIKIAFNFAEQHEGIDGNYMDGTYLSSFDFSNNQALLPPRISKQKPVIVGRPVEAAPDAHEPDYPIPKQMNKNDDMVVAVFEISNKVDNVESLLTGPPQHNMQNAKYLSLISDATLTICTLVGRRIMIEGYNEESVNDALSRFERLQTTYIGCYMKPMTVPCLHYSCESDSYQLFLCRLKSYRYKSLITFSDHVDRRSLYIILPVFSGPPRDMIQRKRDIPNRINISPAPSLTSSLSSLLSPGYDSSSMPSTPIPIPGHAIPSYLPEQSAHVKPLTHIDSTAHVSSSRRSSMSSNSGSSCNHSYKPTLSHNNPSIHQVLQIPLQRAPTSVGSSRPFSQLQMAKSYNFDNIRCGLEKGLEAARGHKGEVLLSAKIGKMLWTNPYFNDVITSDNNTMNGLLDILPTPTKPRRYHEFYCLSRNQKGIPYQPIIIQMKDAIIEAQKVIYSQKVVTEIDWMCLDRKLDFQLSLKVQDHIRRDVKPIKTFVKKVAMNPTTGALIYEDVPDFLRVKKVLLKETTQYRIQNYVIEVTRVEKLATREAPMNEYQPRKQIIAEISPDNHWFETEIYDASHSDFFDINKNLGVAKAASWKPDDILGKDYNSLKRLIAFILTFIEQAEEKYKMDLAVYLVLFLVMFGFIVFVAIIPIQIIWLYVSYYIVCTANPGIITPKNIKAHLDYYKYDRLIYAPKDCSTYLLDPNIVQCVKRIYRGMIIEWGLDKAYIYDPLTHLKTPISFYKAFLYILQHDRIIGAIGILAAVVSVVVFIFLAYQIYLAGRGITTNEAFKWEMIEDAIDRGELFKIENIEKSVNGHIHAFYVLVKDREERQAAANLGPPVYTPVPPK